MYITSNPKAFNIQSCVRTSNNHTNQGQI